MEPSTLIGHVGCARHLREGVWVMLIQTSSRYNLLFGGQGDNFAAVISLAIRHLQYEQSPALQKVKSLHQQCSRSHWTSASGLPSFPAAPTRPARPAGVQGRREVIIGKAGVPPFPTNRGNTFTRLSSGEQQK